MRRGDLVTDFTLTDHAGQPFTLSAALTRGPVVLFFYPAAHTKGCTKESCHFRDVGPAFDALGAQRIGISMDDEVTQARFATQNQLDYPLLADVGGRVAKQFGVKRGLDLFKVRRTTFVIDVDERILDVISSELSMEIHADRALEVLAAR
jgi:peroxiredoxin Q/BCP